jgi:hypothetical protein
MRILPIILVLLMLTGCYNVRTPLVSYDAPAAVQQSSSKEHKETFKEKYGMSKAVTVLLGLGAVFMATGLSAAYYDDESDEVALVFGATGIVLWGSAGMAYGVEEGND